MILAARFASPPHPDKRLRSRPKPARIMLGAPCMSRPFLVRDSPADASSSFAAAARLEAECALLADADFDGLCWELAHARAGLESSASPARLRLV